MDTPRHHMCEAMDVAAAHYPSTSLMIFTLRRSRFPEIPIQSLSQTVAGLIRRGLSLGKPGEVARSARTGLPVAHLGRTITSEDVRRLEDDDQ